MSVSIRVATPADVPALQALIPDSARRLSAGFYSTEQAESAIQYVFGVDSQLIADGTYFVAEIDGRLAGCGGWSRRRTLYGGDQHKSGDDDRLTPGRDAARIRAFFVHPEMARRGVGSALMHACMDAARAAGFTSLELMSTLPGVPLYRAFGFEGVQVINETLPNGVNVPFVKMTRTLMGGERGGEKNGVGS